MRIFEGLVGAALAWAGAANSLFAEANLDQAAVQAALAVVAVIGGIWVMAKVIFSRQEARIAFLEKQNADQQRLIEDGKDEHSTCRETVARLEERFSNLSGELQRLRQGREGGQP